MPLLAHIGEPLLNEEEYNVHELPSGSNVVSVDVLSLLDNSLNDGQQADQYNIQVIFNVALIAHIKF